MSSGVINVGQSPRIESINLSRDLAMSASRADYEIRPLQITIIRN